MSAAALCWLIAAPYIIFFGGLAAFGALAGALILFDRLFITPAANIIDTITGKRRDRQ